MSKTKKTKNEYDVKMARWDKWMVTFGKPKDPLVQIAKFRLENWGGQEMLNADKPKKKKRRG